MSENSPRAHRQACLRLTLSLLLVWFLVSYGCAIPVVTGWTQICLLSEVRLLVFGCSQGSILVFVVILIAYAF